MRIPAFFATLFIIAMVIGTGCTGEARPSSGGEVLQEAVTGIDDELTEVRVSMGESARVLGETGLTSTTGKEAVRQAMLNHPYTESTLVVTKDSIVVMAVPDDYAGTVGSDISSHLETGRSIREQVPLVSEVFPLAEGYAGVAQSYPIFGEDGEYLGFASIAYRPDTLIGRVVAPLVDGTPYEIRVIQTDGRVIYDMVPEEIGQNLVSDSTQGSPALQETFSRIAAEPSGSLEYSFEEQHVTKRVVWGTAGIDGTEWRVIVIESLDAGGVPAATG